MWQLSIRGVLTAPRRHLPKTNKLAKQVEHAFGRMEKCFTNCEDVAEAGSDTKHPHGGGPLDSGG